MVSFRKNVIGNLLTLLRWLAVSPFVFCLVPLRSATPAGEMADLCVVRPADTGEALVNPGMGWTFHFYSNILRNYGSRLDASDTLDDFPGLSTIYLRLPWAYIEPEEGKFDWSVVDAPSQRWIDTGKRVAFRFTCTESWMRYATPKWVQDAGAKGYNFRPGRLEENGPFWEPDYADPVFLEKLDRFLAAAAARYDGSPHVDFIDIGSFGVWGEGHTFHSTKLSYPPEVLKQHIDLHAKHFKKTLLAVNDDFVFLGARQPPGDAERDYAVEPIRYALQKGMTLRDDSILVQPPPRQYYHADLAQWFWPRVPVILECEHYGSSRNRGAWGDGSWYLRAVEEYHASYVSIHWWPREFLEEQRDLVDGINRRLGYRLQLREMTWPSRISRNERLTVCSTWANGGVAPCYRGGYMAVTLKDTQGGIVAVFVEERFDVAELQVGPPEKAPEKIATSDFGFAPNMRSGKFDFYVSVGDRIGTPEVALPLKSSDGHRRYKLGEIGVVGE
jgi:hypothetical protein